MNSTLSIVIPTRNRHDTLAPVIEAIVSRVRESELQIVVEDNSDVDAPDEFLALVERDQRLRYRRTTAPRSIVENTAAAIKNADGDYMTFIGDDDFVAPEIFRAVRLLADSGLDCLIYPPARYWWPTVTFARETRWLHPRAFWLPERRSGAVRRLDPDEQLLRLLAIGGTAQNDMPRFYHGLVSRRGLENIRRRTGTYVPGSSPDMAYSVALALEGGPYLHVDYPVTVFGASKGSGGGRTAAKRHYGRLEDQAHLPVDILQRWDPRLPRIWSEQTIYPQTIYEVLRSYGCDDRIAYDAFYAALLVNEPHLGTLVLPLLGRWLAQSPVRSLGFARQLTRKILGRLKRATQTRSALMPFELHDFDGVAQAMDFLHDEVPFPQADESAR